MGEVLLIGAEAAYYAGEEELAVKWLNLVRHRANLKASPSTSGTALLEQIWKDKRLEIALEWSNRYYELVRIDKLYPGYMMAAMDAKVNDEFDGIEQHLNDTNGWGAINKPNFPITKENFRTMIPLCNKLELPRNYTMPIPTTVLSDMLNVKQTQYYR
jgi:ragB/susD domain protein